MQNFWARKGDFSRLWKLPIFQFLAKPEKTALHLCLFTEIFLKMWKISEKFWKSKKVGLQQENPPKNDDFAKIVKKLTFFLKNRFTAVKFWRILKINPKCKLILGPLKKGLCVLKEFNLKERHVIFSPIFCRKKDLPVRKDMPQASPVAEIQLFKLRFNLNNWNDQLTTRSVVSWSPRSDWSMIGQILEAEGPRL